jgi:AcrR family transcriptional regulator
MPRKYDSSRRVAAAQQTRQDIVEAAFRLHGQGITDIESLAKEANVSVPTVRKHFPTREHVFEGCTSYGFHAVPMPDLNVIAAVEDPLERVREGVRQLYTTYEHLTGQLWVGYRFQEESPVMAAVLEDLGATVRDVVRVILAAWPGLEGKHGQGFGAVLGFLSPLTHRALRVEAGLTAEQVLAATTAAVLQTLQGGRIQSVGAAR